MPGISLKLSWRNFQIYSKSQKSSLKEKLRNLEQRQVLLKRSSKEQKRLEEKKRLQIRRAQKKAYSKEKALHLIRKDLDQDLKKIVIGPTSDSDLKYLLKAKDKRLIYTILGINGNQLRDSVLIGKDVKKFLKRGSIEKAVMLTRLGKHRASAGMNFIMEYFFHELKAPQLGIDMYNWRKKWGIPPNEFTNTILFDGLARQKNLIKKANAILVLKAVERSIEKQELTQIEFNAALGALSNCNDVVHAFELFQRKIKGIKRDCISYLWILRACQKVSSDTLFQELLGSIMANIPPEQVDAQLLFEFCKTLHSRSNNIPLQRMTVLALRTYFEIDFNNDQFWPPPAENFQLLPLSHWSFAKRFPLNASVIGLFLDNCLQSKLYSLGIKFFQHFNKSNIEILDLAMYHRCMELEMKANPLKCGESCLEIFEKIENNPKFISSKHSLVLLCKAFEKQATKKANNSNEIEINKFLSRFLDVIKEAENIYSKEFGRLHPSQSWPFIFATVRAANANGALNNRTLTRIIDEYLRSFLHGEFTTLRVSPDTLKFSELECVRLLNQLAFRMSVSDDDQEADASLSSLERKIFLQRRRLRQFKNLLLERLDSSDEHEELDSQIRKKALMILNDHNSNEYISYVLAPIGAINMRKKNNEKTL